MILTLEVCGPREGTRLAESRKVFRAAGGTIGRLPDNDWVLADPYISARHARIRYADGTFLIEDLSTNGVFINSPDNRLVHGHPYALKSGDRILIDPYEIQVSIEAPLEDPFLHPPLDDPFGLADPAGPARLAPQVPPESYAAPDASGDEEVDPIKLIGGRAPARKSGRGREPEAPPHAPPWREHYAPPAPAGAEPDEPSRGAGGIPTGYDPLADEIRPRAAAPAARSAPPPAVVRPPQKARVPARASAPAEERASGGDFDLAQVLAGAGLDSAAVTPELARVFGEILRVVVSGLMDVLQARQRTKAEFGMGNTVFKPADNNPLKFSANVEDALHNLLVKRNAAYLGPVEAFEDAFDDVRNHQIAMLAGVRVAFDAMLARFDPDRLQQQFDRQKKGALVSVPAKLRYWDLYREWIHDMVHDADDSFRELFGDEFAQAYEEQLNRLRTHGRSRKR